MTNILEGTPQRSLNPMLKTSLPFKKLAQSLIKELKHETLVVDGQDIAPNLYTILISAFDNAVMSRYYQELTRELQTFLEHQAKELKLAFEERPLVRFIVDDKLKAGRFFIIVENVSPLILSKLRREEEAFLSGKPLPSSSYDYKHSASHSLELSRPLPLYQDQLDQINMGKHFAEAAAPVAKEACAVGAAGLAGAEAGAALADIADNMSADIPIFSAYEDLESGACLIYRAIGRKFLLKDTENRIGRDDTQTDITILDAKISRYHARIFKDNDAWILQDMNSTNGSFVNGQRIVERELINGDIIVLGGTEFSFKEA